MSQSTLLYSASNQTTTTASTWYGAFNADGALRSLITTEAQAQQKWRGGSCVVQNMRAWCNSNSRTSASTATFRVNTASPGAGPVVTMGATGGQGLYSDTTNSASLADGDLIDYQLTTVGTGTLAANITVEVLFASGQGKAPIANCGTSSAITGAGFCPVGGGNLIRNPTEANNQTSCLETTATTANLQLYVSSGDATGVTFTVKKNSANPAGQQSITTGAAGTGFFEDTTHSTSLALNDTYSYSTTAPAISITIRLAAVTYASGDSTKPRQTFSCNLITDGPFSTNSTSYTAFGNNNSGGTETTFQMSAPQTTGSYTLSMLSAFCSTYTLAAGSLITRTRVNAANGTLITTHTATGLQQDTTHSDSLASGDKFNLQYVSAGSSGGATLVWVGGLITGAVTSSGGVGGMTTMGVG